MYRTKKDVDKHVESLLSKLSAKEFKTRAYSIARLYFEVGDYLSCEKYVQQYLTQKDNNAAAHKLLGLALQKLGQKEKALEQYKTSLDIDPSQTSTVLDICELLADDEVNIDPGRAKYWCEKAEATFPRHPITFRLRERLVSISNPDPEALVKLLTAELNIRPRDALLHSRLVKHYLQTNQAHDAFDHCCNVEFGESTFRNNSSWYETLTEVLKHNLSNVNNWLYQLLLLTVRERACVLSLTEIPSGTSKSLAETSDLLHVYDQALESVAISGAPSGFGEFCASLLQHHRGQFAFHAATFLLKKAKKDQISWRDATRFAAPLMLLAWQTVPLDLNVNWLTHAPVKQQKAVHRWYTEGAYRCSQSAHYLLRNNQDKSQSFLDRIAQYCSGTHWKDKLYEKLFASRDHLAKIKSSHFVSNAYNSPVLRLPRKIEVEAYDIDAQKEYSNSLHHFVWMLSNYKNYAEFKCYLFDMLKPISSSCGPESLNKLDVHAFLYCATFTSAQQKPNNVSYASADKPLALPANITDLLCTLPQMKWWDCAYKFSQNVLGAELTDIRATLSRGIDVVRCIDNHGLDPELLCKLGDVFSEKAKTNLNADEKINLEFRSKLYYSSAIPILEKLKSKFTVKVPEKRLFDYTHKELSAKEISVLLEKSKLYVAQIYLNDCDYERVIDLLSDLKSPKAFYQLSQTYKNIALDDKKSKENSSTDTKTKYALLSKAKSFAYKALDKAKDADTNTDSDMYADILQVIEEIETNINKLDPDLSSNVINDGDGKYSSDENISGVGELPLRNNHVIRNLSSTPKQPSHANATSYRTAIDSHILETTRVDQNSLERIESQIKSFQKRITEDFMEQTKSWFDENRRLGNQIMSTLQSDIQNTNDQFKLLKISVDQVKDQMEECRNECKDVGDLKKQIADLKKEVNKLKKSSSEPTINESDLYNLEEDFRTNDSSSTFATQLPFQNPQVMAQFNQRLLSPFSVPPNPYQLYSQNLYNFYNQYSQFAQNPVVPGVPPLFDPTRASGTFPAVFPTADQMYLDVAHLIPPAGVPQAPTIPPVPPAPAAHTITSLPNIPPAAVPTIIPATPVPKPVTSASLKDVPRSMPVNVVITSSDPLPTCTTTPSPILSVTIPQKHIKGTPHNYQISMPPSNDNKLAPIFTIPAATNKTTITTSGTSVINWQQSNIFKTDQGNTTPGNLSSSLFQSFKTDNSIDNSKSVVDGSFANSPNTSLNKSRTLSERSNTSVDYDPCPDFKPIIPLPDEVKVTTGEEDESAIFSSRAKLFRFADKQWKERGIGEIKLLKHKETGKVRVLMRREQVHKICANHIITPEMEIKPMKNETKAYFWVANDYADEKVVLEKFCIRFKTADIGQQFYEAFETARKHSEKETSKPEVNSKIFSNKLTINQLSTPIKDTVSAPTSQANKNELGGFTFSSTPTLKPIMIASSKAEPVSLEQITPKSNFFSNLTFKTNNSNQQLPFSNLFTSPATHPINTSSPKPTNTFDKLSNSDVVEEFEPTVEFKPVVPLPALVDQKTGEENEIVLFEHRAKLLRYDSANIEWKERGLGNIKLLVHKENNQKVRLLMRREQIMKICCNHGVTKEMTFQKMPKMDKAVTWCAKDFSDGELVPETFCLRFKTVQTCDDFIQAVKDAQCKLQSPNTVEVSGNTSEPKFSTPNVVKSTNEKGFGDKFKPKLGSWECNACLIRNEGDVAYCNACNTPKDPSLPQKETQSSETTSKFKFGITSAVKPVSEVAGFGDKFKPKLGSWECNACLIRNEGDVAYCNACNTPKDPSLPQKETQSSETISKFKFGITSAVKPVSEVAGFGDKFKPKVGSWECNACLIRNEGDVAYCNACNTTKDPSLPENKAKEVSENSSNFKFGIPAQSSATVTPQVKESIVPTTTALTSVWGDKFKQKIGSWECKQCFVRNESDVDKCTACTNPRESKVATEPKFSFGVPSNGDTTSIFDGTGAHKFSFGSTVMSNKPAAIIPFGQQNTPTLIESERPINLAKISDDSNQLTPNKATSETGSFGGKESGKFDFVFKPKGKSPVKSPGSQKGDESDDNEYASEDEGHHIHFNPVVPMPDKVDVVTGEENETELYGHRAKLFRFMSGEWKERGIGIVKILKHKETGKLRVVMRREQVLKICLNHALTNDVTYSAKDEKSWLFVANDFSEGELSWEKFCLRFKTKEIALEYKEAIDKARNISPVNKDTESDQKDSESDDVVFVCEIQATVEEKQKAKDLMLPENFYTYKNKEPCQGCRGCDNDDEKVANTPATALSVASTPVKTTPSIFQSPMSDSLYGTPTNSDKTFDTSIFRTPLGLIGSNTNAASPFTPNSTITSNGSTNKENTVSQKSIFSGLSGKQSIFAPQTKGTTVFGSDTQSNTKTVLATPKLSTSLGSEKTEAKSIFGSSASSNIFGTAVSGISSNSSLFGGSSDNKAQQSQVKSLFGGEDKSVNFFSNTTQGSIFGPGALPNNQQKFTGSIFGSNFNSNMTQPQVVFGQSNSIFKTDNDPSKGPALPYGQASKPFITPTNAPSDNTKPDLVKQEVTTKKDTPFNVDNSLSFAALSTSEPSFIKKADFQWEGAGQQLFGQKPSNKGDKSKNDSSAGDEVEAVADEEYDPHYEPIVPLPDKIVVTTGEEDEEKMFGERGKLYRYDDKSREWKERGVGEMKILYHPERKTYRLLLRREQVHKAVLNMLLFMDLELLPMKNSDRAWTWAGRNFAENLAGEQETLAVRFKSVDLATSFKDKVDQCVRKLQAAAAQEIMKEKEANKNQSGVAPLRLPKHLQDSARADPAVDTKVAEQTNSQEADATKAADMFKHVQYQQPDEDGADEADYEHENYDHNEYYYEEEDESANYYSCDGEAIIEQGDSKTNCEQAHIQVLFDQEIYSPKILVTDANTGEILADMLIYTETEFHLEGGSCTWSGTDYTSNDPVDKTVTINFYDEDTAMQFYDSCETSKAATYSSTDPES